MNDAVGLLPLARDGVLPVSQCHLADHRPAGIGASVAAGWVTRSARLAWLFLVEALPPIIMTVVTWIFLTDRLVHATWLRPEQRSWLQQRLDSEQSQREAVHRFDSARR
jgi:hypothetical protein